MKNKIINFVINHPYRSFLFLCILFFPFLTGLTQIKEDYGARIWYAKDNPMVEMLNQYERTYGNEDTIGLGIYNESGIFDKKTLELIEEVTEKTWLLRDVIRVDSISNYNWTYGKGDEIIVEPFYENISEKNDFEIKEIEKKALSDKVLPRYLIGPDSKLALVFGKLRPSFGRNLNNQLIVNEARALADELNKKTSNGARVFVIGSAAITDAYRDVSRKDLQVTLPLLLAVIIGFLFYTFRSKEGIVLPLILIAISVAITFGFAPRVDITFNNLAATIPGILTAICIADTVHVLATLYMKLGSGLDLDEALRESLKKNLGPTLLTSISTAIGFGTLVTSNIVPIKDLGILAAFGTSVAWILTIFFIPAIFKIFPTGLFIPKDGFKERKKRFLTMERCQAYVNFLFKHKIKIIVVFTFLTISAIYLSFQNTVNSNPLNYFSQRVKIKQDYDLVKDHMGGIGGPQIVVHAGKPDGVKSAEFLMKVEKYERWIKENIEGVATTVSALDIIKKMNQVFNGGDEKFYRIPDNSEKIAQFLFLYSISLPQGMGIEDKISIDFENMRIGVIWENHNSNIATKNIEKINSAAKDFGLNGYVSGQMPLYQRLNSYVVDTFFTSMGLAILLVGIFMIYIFRSFKLGFLSMLPNIIPLTFGGALMALTDSEVDLGAAINYSVCLGVVVDDTIHFLFDYDRNRKLGYSVGESLVNVFYHTGPALILTTAILTVGFGMFVVSNFIPNINFGLFCSLIFSMALIVDFVFLPALLLFPIKDLGEHRSNAIALD